MIDTTRHWPVLNYRMQNNLRQSCGFSFSLWASTETLVVSQNPGQSFPSEQQQLLLTMDQTIQLDGRLVNNITIIGLLLLPLLLLWDEVSLHLAGHLSTGYSSSPPPHTSRRRILKMNVKELWFQWKCSLRWVGGLECRRSAGGQGEPSGRDAHPHHAMSIEEEEEEGEEGCGGEEVDNGLLC